MSVEERLRQLLDERIAVLDGAWGTMLQRAGLTDADYRASASPTTRATSPATPTCSI